MVDMKEKVRHALIEYISHGVFILLAYLIYFQFPYFQNFLQPQVKMLLTWLVIGYASLGLVYFLLRDHFFWDIYGHRDNKSTIVILYLWHSIPGLVRFIRKIPHDRSFM